VGQIFDSCQIIWVNFGTHFELKFGISFSKNLGKILDQIFGQSVDEIEATIKTVNFEEKISKFLQNPI